MTINTVNSGYQPSNIETSDVKKAESNNRFVDKLKKACTNILNKLGFFKAKSLSNTQTSSLELKKVTMRFDKEVSVEIDVDASINLKNIKEIWQAGLINVRQTKGEEAWANAVVANFQNDRSTVGKIFSQANGIFYIDKLSSEELAAIEERCNREENPSLELKVFKTFIGIENPKTSIEDKYNSLRSLENEIFDYLKGLYGELDKKQSEGKLTELSKFLNEKMKIYKGIKDIGNAIHLNKRTCDVTTPQDIMNNFTTKFFQRFLRYDMPINNAIEALEKNDIPKVNGAINEFKNVIKGSERTSELMEKVRVFLEEHPQKNKQLADFESISVGSLSSYVEAHNLETKRQSS